ncbi:unnamed protein product [Moneuplotes crassus]|uniref:Sphingomyelin phosphodiesterase n=1 Tax=Euplotes crassus TaxID=5936 RepID=A0AAD1XFS6_EUPCR|nr:unnamed protein product [Moneuplotes crassus]
MKAETGKAVQRQFDEEESLEKEDFSKGKKAISQDLESPKRKDTNAAKVLSINMFLRPVVKTNDSDYKYERLQELLGVIHNFDIMCFQEVFSGFNSHKPILLTISKKFGFDHYFHSSKPGYFEKYLTDGGLVNLSKYPIIESHEETFVKSIGDCSIAKKGILFTKIEMNGNYLYLFNTHLQANYYTSFALYKKCIDTKMYQLKQLSEYIEEKTKNMRAQDKILLVGDFNISNRRFNSYLKKQFESYAKNDPGFNIFFEEGFDCLYEAEIMMKILSLDGLFNVTDLKSTLGDEEGAPATFAGTLTLDDGSKAPVDTALMGKIDVMTEQSLDYIFALDRNDMKKDASEDFKAVDNHLQSDIRNNEHAHDLDSQRLLTKEKGFYIRENTIAVEKFILEGKKYGTISDHFGLSVEINNS